MSLGKKHILENSKVLQQSNTSQTKMPSTVETWRKNEFLLTLKCCHAAAKAHPRSRRKGSQITSLDQYVMVPHDIIASIYNYESPEIFYYLFLGPPGVPHLQIQFTYKPMIDVEKAISQIDRMPLISQAIEDYWKDNQDLRTNLDIEAGN